MPRPKTISDEDILHVARRCFQERGHSVSTRVIADEAGISQSVLYQRFGDKEAMFLRAMMPEPPDVDALLECPEDLPADEYVRLVLERLVHYFQTALPALLHLFTYPGFDVSLVEGAHERLMAERVYRALAARFEVLVERGELAEHSGEALATAVLGLAHTVGMQSVIALNGRLSALQVEQQPQLGTIVDVLWRGMAPRPIAKVETTRSPSETGR